MRTSKSIYLIIALVIIVWGILIYRVLFTQMENKEILIKSKELKKKSINIQIKRFELTGEYRDPFLNKAVQKPQIQSPKLQEKKKQNQKNSISLETGWPQILFLGMFKNKKEGKELAMLTIQNQSYSLKPGELAAGVLLKKIFKDSVIVAFNKELRIIRK